MNILRFLQTAVIIIIMKAKTEKKNHCATLNIELDYRC
jgi:hypothetical protein